MTALVSVETVLIVLLVVLVAGLLRSHAELLRRLGPGTADPVLPEPTKPRSSAAAPAIAGTTLDGDPLTLDFTNGAGQPTLLAFLSSGCTICESFWERIGDGPPARGIQTVIVAHGPERERPGRLRSLAPAGVPLVLSSAAWEDYAIPGSPHFVLVRETIQGEGTAATWEALSSLVGDALEDAAQVPARDRGRRVDEAFAAAGIAPDDPSLYPAGRD